MSNPRQFATDVFKNNPWVQEPTELERLKKRVEALERATWPNSYPRFPVPTMPIQDQAAYCGTCGLRLEGSMGYCCPRQNCPTGLGGASA